MNVVPAMQPIANLLFEQILALKTIYPEIWDAGDDQLLNDCLEAETDIDGVLNILIERMRDAETYAGAVATRIADLEIRQMRFEHRAKIMRDLMYKIMSAAEIKKRELPEVTISIRNVPPSVLITAEENLPDEACKFERKPDKTKIKELLQTGPVAGACMSNGSTTISIRTR